MWNLYVDKIVIAIITIANRLQINLNVHIYYTDKSISFHDAGCTRDIEAKPL